MSDDIFDKLRDSEEDVHLSLEDTKQLVQMLMMVAGTLKTGKLWFNEPGLEYNMQFIEFCERIARKFSNIKIEQEQ